MSQLPSEESRGIVYNMQPPFQNKFLPHAEEWNCNFYLQINRELMYYINVFALFENPQF